MAGLQDKIKHVIVLMLENRSFDCLLGSLYPAGPGFNGLTGNESNPHTGGPISPIRVWNDPAILPGTMTAPSADPGEVFDDMNIQRFGLGGTPSQLTPTQKLHHANHGIDVACIGLQYSLLPETNFFLDLEPENSGIPPGDSASPLFSPMKTRRYRRLDPDGAVGATLAH